MPYGFGYGSLLGALVTVASLYATDRTLSSLALFRVRGLHAARDKALAELSKIEVTTARIVAQENELKKAAQHVENEIANLRETASPTSSTSTTVVHTRKEFKLNQVVVDSMYCRSPTWRARENLPTFIFVAGIEGSGHHALKDVWQSLKQAGMKIRMIVYDQIFHSLGIENHAGYHYSSISNVTYAEHLSPVFKLAGEAGELVIDAQNSYPMGKGAGPLAHPDLLKLTEFDGILYNLRVVVMFRNPVDAVLSAVRRFQDSEQHIGDETLFYKNYEFQARMVSESLATINNALRHLPCGGYMVMQFEKLVQSPGQFIDPLAQLLGVKSTILQSAFSKLHPVAPKVNSHERVRQRGILKSFFDIQSVLWPLLSTI